MSDLKKKLDVAKINYEAATAALKIARDHYEGGPQKEYAAVKENIASLKTKIAEHESVSVTARNTFSHELRASRGATTAAAKSALNERRNSEELIEECRLILEELEKQEYALRFTISEAAADYRRKYTHATECWALVNTYSVLVGCGEQLCKAMAVRPWQEGEKVRDEHAKILVKASLAENVIRTEIDASLKNYQGETQPYLSELGTCDFGAFSVSEIMSPCQMHMAKVKLQPQ